MIEFTIEKSNYIISDLTIGQYYRIQNLLVTQDYSAKTQIISELSGCTQDDLRKLDAKQFNTLWITVFGELFSHTENYPLHKTIEFKGKLYGFIDMNKLTVGELVDMDIMSVSPNREKLLHKMLAILYRPAYRTLFSIKVDPYASEELDERAELFLDMPMKYVFGATNFFLQVPKSLLKITLASLVKKEKDPILKKAYEQLSQSIQPLLETGSELSHTSLETILQKLVKSSNSLLLPLSIGSHTEKIKPEKKRNKLRSLLSKQGTN